ncbi:MAG: MFS transporter [Oscillospiraceae bacterium]|nr:MFS transporter [Oscillospiraceae bacterium]
MKMKRSNFSRFLLLWAGELMSSIGSGLTAFGLGVYIFNRTGSAANMALVTLLGFLPTLLLSVPSGVLADRYDRRALMMAGDGLSALGVVYILICMIRGDAGLADICIGVFISSVFSSLTEPSYRATVTDLLTKEEYSKANGLVSLAGSARYLFSPVIAGILLTYFDVKLLLIIDICTFFLTISSAAAVRKAMPAHRKGTQEPFLASMKAGRIIADNRGVMMLVVISSVITMFMGMFQILAEPLILSFQDAGTLGIAETVCAGGMLVSGVVIGIRGIKRNFVKTLGISLALSGIFMAGFGMIEDIVPICISGFLFFAALPFANNCLDYLARTNISDEMQGRAWGMIGFISQLGYVAAYGVSGIAADALGRVTGLGVGRGAALLIIASGILLALSACMIPMNRSIRALEKNEDEGVCEEKAVTVQDAT